MSFKLHHIIQISEPNHGFWWKFGSGEEYNEMWTLEGGIGQRSERIVLRRQRPQDTNVTATK